MASPNAAIDWAGEFWKPVLRGQLYCFIFNAQQENVPGRKTDVKDAEWIVQLLQFTV